jgi:hypothetical protein
MESPAHYGGADQRSNPPLRCGASYTPPGPGPNGLGLWCGSAHPMGIMRQIVHAQRSARGGALGDWDGAMQDPGYGLPRIVLLGTSVSKSREETGAKR